MKIDKVLVSTDDNPLYLDFWESCSRVWKEKMGLDPVLLYFGRENPTEKYGEVVRFETLSDYPIHLQTVWSRFWFPSTQPDLTFCTSDIDMYPLNRKYFVDMIDHIPTDYMVHLTNHTTPVPACYHVGLGRQFKKLLMLPETFEQSMAELVACKFRSTVGTHPELGFKDWGLDEAYPTQKLSENEMNKTSVHLPYVPTHKLDRYPSHRRLDRSNWSFKEDDIAKGMYLDCHSIRPYTQHRESIEKVIAAIPYYNP